MFNVNPKIRFQDNTIHCRLYSKQLYYFLSNEFAFPIGEKKNRLIILEIILSHDDFLKAFLRGVYDTDGSFHAHYKNSDAVVEFISESPAF